MEDKNDFGVKISRKEFLKKSLFAVLGVLVDLQVGSCFSNSLEGDQGFKGISYEEAKKITQEYLLMIADIQKNPQKYGVDPNNFKNFQLKVNQTYPGISLRYSDDPFIASIRKRPLNEALILAIAGLNLMETSRYNQAGIYTCNVYALDLARAVLGNENIGDRYQSNTGKPFSFGITDLDWSNKDSVKAIDEQFPYLHGNNFAWWAEKFGKKYGWRLINLSEFLAQKACFNVLGIYCSSQEEIARQRQNDPNFYGHMGVIFNPFPDKSYILTRSQATNHYPFEVLTTDPLHPLIQGILKGNFKVYFHAYNSS